MRNEKGQFVKGHKTWLGKHHTQESKRKMSESQKGKSLGFIPKMAFKKGDIPWSKGKTFSKQYRKKISEGHKGQIPWSKGKKLSKEHKQKIKLVHIGKHYSPKTEFKKDHIVPKGKDHWGWKGGKDKRALFMVQKEYILWRTAVFMRDNYTCRECGERGGELHADHINSFALYPELRLAIDNGQTLCIDCHKIKTLEDIKLTKNFKERLVI